MTDRCTIRSQNVTIRSMRMAVLTACASRR
jgi:hypothetical protein